MNRFRWALVVGFAFSLIIAAAVGVQAADGSQTSYKFDFGPGSGSAREGRTLVAPDAKYNDDRGYGFEPVAAGSKATLFSVKLPEGNYRVKLTTGDANEATGTTVKAELRRLMLESIRTEPGQFRTSEFVVNTRSPKIAGDGSVRLKDREKTSEWRAWDDRLTLEFNGEHPAVTALDIEPVADLPVLYIIGDSTVCDQPSEPYNSWGQMLTRFFAPTIVLANHGESGESYRAAIGAHRFDKIFSLMRPGDFLLMQFGHNDMKSVDERAYAASIRRVVEQTRAKGGRPIIVTSMERNGFNEDGTVKESLKGFPQAARDVAKEVNVPLVDLNAMSKKLYVAIGREKLARAFAAPGGKPDATHHNNYGSYQLAKCMVEGIRQNAPDLAQHLVAGLPTFDPSHPQTLETFAMPASPETASDKPEGS